MDGLSQSWNVNVGSYVITVISGDERGDLETIAKIITKYTSIASVISLDVEEGDLVHRMMFTLPASVDEKRLHQIISNLERKGFRVPEVENLKQDRL